MTSLEFFILKLHENFELLITLGILLIIILKILNYYSPKIKGFIGEYKVKSRLSKLNNDEYKVIHNLRIFYNGIMSQIDHIVISKYGIFVIETKNYKGVIYGGEKSYEWTQTHGYAKTKFYNPIKQNIGHIKALQANLSENKNINFFPIVVFTGKAKLKINSSFPVVHTHQLINTINSQKNPNLHVEKIEDIYNNLLIINGVKTNLPAKIYTENPLACPLCHSELVIRNGKNGRFFGCTNYPNCLFTKGIIKQNYD